MPYPTELLISQVVRIVAMYAFTIMMLRLAGKRRIASLSPADLIIIIALGSAVGDVLVYPQGVVPIEFAMLAVGLVIVLQIAVSKATEKNPALSYIIEGKRTMLIKDGKVLDANIDAEDVSYDDLREMLAERGVANASQVQEAHLERSGELSIILKPLEGRQALLPRRRFLHRKRL